MKILIISGDFYPGNSPRSFRTTELTKELSRQGHDVTVYIPGKGFDYTCFIKEYPITLKTFKEYPDKRQFIGIKIIDRIIFHCEHWLIDRPSLKNYGEVQKAVIKESNYDFLITIAVPHYIHWAIGKLYAKGHRMARKWVADCGDSYMLNKIIKPPFYFKPLEMRWCKQCDYISVPLESEKENYYEEFADKIKVIPQGFNFDDVICNDVEPNNPIVTFMFAGSFIPRVRDPRPLLDYLCTIDKNFRFIIYTSNSILIDPYRDKLGVKLEIRKYIPRLEVIGIMKKCDFLINIDNGATKGMPSKLIDYALSGRPILSLTSSNIDTANIDSFINRDYSRKYIVEDISKYDIHNVVKQFLVLTKKITKQ